MIILKNNLFSKSDKLPESRIGIGWLQEKLGKNDAEKYFKIGQKAADESYKKGEDEETTIKKSKRTAGNKLILDKSGKPILKGLISAGGGYILAKSPNVVESLARSRGIDLNIPKSIKNLSKKHAGKIATAAGIITAGKYIPDIYNKQKSVRTGVEINTKNRLKKQKDK